jgi:hypothetical protein
VEPAVEDADVRAGVRGGGTPRAAHRRKRT